MSAPQDNAELDAYVARQAATVGRAPVAEGRSGAPNSPIGKWKGASGACLGIFDEYDPRHHGGGAGGVAFAADGRSVFYARDDGLLNRWALPSGALVWGTPPNEAGRDGFFSIAVSPDGRHAVTTQKNRCLRLYDVETGRLVWQVQAPNYTDPWSLSYSPDGKEFAAAGTREVHIHDARTGQSRLQIKPNAYACFGVAWSPTGKHIATGDGNGTVSVWDVKTGVRLFAKKNHNRDINGVAWSPDGTRIASASEDRTLCIWAPFGDEAPRYLEGHENFLWCVAWSPEGLRIATGANDRTLRVWDAARGTELARYEFPEIFAFRIAWSPDGALLASSHPCAARMWDTRETLHALAPAPQLLVSGPLPVELAILPGALVALLRIRRAAPISLLRDLLALTAGRLPSRESEPLAAHPGMSALASLRWPADARVAFVLLLLREFEDTSFAVSEEIPFASLRWRLLDVLAGAIREPETPPLPIAYLLRALDGIDERVLTLLGSLGPKACADDPTLPLSLLDRLSEVSPKIAVDRRLLALRVPTTSLGAAEAKGPWLEPSGFSSNGALLHLVPSQWALPDDLFRYRSLTGGLLYRARFGREPPRLRPLVLVLDVSPTSFGPVEFLLRSAAHALAASLLEADIPCFFVAAGGDNTTRPITRRADLFEILTARARAPVSTGKTMAHAAELCASLPSNGPFPPAIVLLSHPAFGAEDTDVPVPPRLAGFFVHYPGHPIEPAWRRRCARAVCIGPSDVGRLPEALGQVLA